MPYNAVRSSERGEKHERDGLPGEDVKEGSQGPRFDEAEYLEHESCHPGQGVRQAL